MPTSRTDGSAVKNEMIGVGKSRSVSAAIAMKETPSAMAIQPDRAAPSGSRRPTAWPTRTAAAEATP